MGTKPVEVIAEGFGSKGLRTTLTREQLQGKTVDDVVRLVLGQKWQGSDSVTYTSLMRKLETSSGSYRPSVAKGGIFIGDPVKFDPVSPYNPAERYIQQTDKQADQLRIAITPAHITA